jgi:hypothetical protein
MMRFLCSVKKKPCVRCTRYMHLISWIHPRGSETKTVSPHAPTNPTHISINHVTKLSCFHPHLCAIFVLIPPIHIDANIILCI